MKLFTLVAVTLLLTGKVYSDTGVELKKCFTEYNSLFEYFNSGPLGIFSYFNSGKTYNEIHRRYINYTGDRAISLVEQCSSISNESSKDYKGVCLESVDICKSNLEFFKGHVNFLINRTGPSAD